MRLLKKYFNRENKFSLKERFNMVMTVVTCFFMGVMGENGRGMQGIKGLIDGIGGLAVRMNGWLSVVTGWELGAHEAYEIYEKGIVGRFFQGKMLEGIDVVKRGQALVERAGLRGRRGNRIRDVSHEKGLPCMERWGCRGSP